MPIAQPAKLPEEDESFQNKEKKLPFDTVIVFGQGPIKPILLPEQLSPAQFRKLDLFLSNQLVYKEPDFWLMQNAANLQQLRKIDALADCTPAQKKRKKEALINEWQHKGWYALKRMGRQNALAAGLALYKGLTKEVILSGGATMSKTTKRIMPQRRLKTWPTEAELMKEVIVSSYGALYEKKYGKKIETAIKIEDASTNTLENFAYCLNLYPHLLAKDKKIGFLSARHHMKRIYLLSQIFGLTIADPKQASLSSQKLLEDAEDYENNDIIDEKNCVEIKRQYNREDRWIRGLSSPEYLTYWLGYVAEVKKAYVLQKALKRLEDDAWKKVGAVALKRVKLDVEEVMHIDLVTLAETDPQKYLLLVSALKQFKKPDLRAFPTVQ